MLINYILIKLKRVISLLVRWKRGRGPDRGTGAGGLRVSGGQH